ncbi:MAG: DDE-type integrase/transposase/recombinase [Metallibacterium scheffleri]|jgi:putative transposase|uniref:helix-turn-helix domain-containing protein n=1 Tax=Metallibacterium scheffleri TaxID=993689 RepID=UPI0026EA35C7|nr:helix-turn-helix domain-containing protein [Metallibacterium scheffleri]MCK9366546.1 DDE-type integrase/transposase/recombinase [Metallibacterium scheffleri]
MNNKTDDSRSEPATGHPLARGMVDIQIGALVSRSDRTYRVTQVLDFDSIIGTDVESGRTSSLAVKDLGLASPAAIQGDDIEEIDDAAWRIAQSRYAAIKDLVETVFPGRAEVEACAKQVGVDASTVYRWMRRYRATGVVTSLIPKKRGWRDGRNRIHSDADAVIREVVAEFYLTKQRPTPQKTALEVGRICKRRKIKPPSNSTIRARIASIPDEECLRKRGFVEKANNRYQARPGKFPGADYPLAVIQMDHTPADIVLVDDTYRKPIGRPWITVAIDVYSRLVIGVYVSFDAPSETSVAMCLAQSIVPKDEWLALHKIDAKWPVWGVPKKVYVDNGPDFRSDALTRSCLPYAIQLEFRKVRTPHYGAHIERLLGTLLREIHALPGTTFSSIKDREGYDSDKHAAMTKGEFEDWLMTLICKVYHERRHSELGMSPLRKWEIGIFGNAETRGMGMPARPADHHTVLLDFLPIFDRTVHPTGVAIDGLTYYAEALRPWINAEDPDARGKKRKMIFRRDPRDISVLWFRDPVIKSYFKIPLANQALPCMSIWEHRAARAKLREAGYAHPNDAQLIAALDELHAKEEASKATTKSARRAAQKRKEHSKAHAPFQKQPDRDSAAEHPTPYASIPPGSALLDGIVQPTGEVA